MLPSLSNERLLGRNIGYLVDTLGWVTRAELAHLVGVSTQNIGQLIRGQNKGLKPVNLVRAAHRFGLSAEDLVTRDLHAEGWSPDANHAQGGASLDWVAHRVPDMRNVEPIPLSLRKLPVLTEVQAGVPREYIDDFAAGAADDYVELDSELAKRLGPYAFALVVVGTSMLPEFHEGEMVIVDPDASVYPGAFVIAKVAKSNGATLKKYRDRGFDEDGAEQFDLVPLNDDFSVMHINAKNPGTVIGVVVEKRKRYR